MFDPQNDDQHRRQFALKSDGQIIYLVDVVRVNKWIAYSYGCFTVIAN